ncbi:RDD family protein [Haloglycomyces albus]|uniref:RDD family protein n=1 Tax=Haloglycomyces albus TaxID=526067 RepID=UPI00046D3FC8|nr:RDD family protein [Haloglycomyces albus]
MSAIEPGWYPNPSDPTEQRYWDGSQWVGKAVAIGEEPPDTPEPLDPEPEPDLNDHTHPDASSPTIIPKAPGNYPPKDAVEIRSMGALVGWIARRDVTRMLQGRALAPPGSRLGARLVDIACVAFLSLVVNFYFLYQLYQELRPSIDQAMAGTPFWEIDTPDDPGLTMTIILLTVGVWFAYEVPTTLNNGQTLGKRIFKIKVVSLAPNDPGWGRNIIRWMYTALPLVCFPWGAFVWLIDGIWCLSDRPFRQCLHDKSPGTIVVDASAEPAEPSNPTKTID